MAEERRAQLKERRQELTQRVDQRVEELLHRINIPTKDSIEELSKSLGSLGRKVDKLRREQEKSIAG
jgi:polyhydroxyalkanoate synthesis regulator phasin